ncbi:MAG: hypothetical protein ABI439_05905 [Rhodospirillales bacterium]
MADKLIVGVVYGSDTAQLPEDGHDFGGVNVQFLGHNDAPRLIDSNQCVVVPVLLTPEYLARNWRYDFNRFDVIFNAMSDPDVGQSSLLMAISVLAGTKTPIVNDPRHVIRTRRDIISGSLRSFSGLLVPKTVRLMPGQTASVVAAEQAMQFPILLRSAGSHSDHETGLIKVETAAELDAALAAGAVTVPAYMSEFVESRNSQGLYLKMRLVICGSTVLLRHYIHSDHWLIKAASQTFMHERPELLEIERKAAADPLAVLPPRGPELLAAIKGRVGLDYFGIDCTPLPDGRLLIFEVNAVMNMLPASRHPGRGPLMVAAIDRVASDFNGLLRQRAGLLPGKKDASLATTAPKEKR